MNTPVVTVVVVLYRTSPSTSLALTTLAESIGPHAHRFAIEVHDNSPERSTDLDALGGLGATYTHHPENPGLAVPYNQALEAAERRGSSWLMLLDQDTQVTPEYVDEVVSRVSPGGVGEKVAVMAPLLAAGTFVLSPAKPLRIRPRPLGPPGEYPPDSAYIYLNSAAVLRVRSVQAVGGFPTEYPLDFLDHAVSARLKAGGRTLLVLESRLQHQLSVLEMAAVPPRRLHSIFRAEERYYFAQPGRAEGYWLVLRRTARAVLLALGVHRSSHREAELSAAWLALRRAARGDRAVPPPEERGVEAR